MPKRKDLRHKGLYSTENIRDEVKKIYNITYQCNDKTIMRHIQRYMVNHHKSSPPNAIGYYERKVVDSYLSNKQTKEHFNKIISGNIDYKSDEALMLERKSELDKNKNELYGLWEKAGLTKEEGNLLEIDKITRKEYLTVEELLYLDKKGLVLKSDLTNEETKYLKLHEQMKQQSKNEEKEIQELFYRKKIEIMITALFNEYYTLNEEDLYNDISLYVHGGGNSIVYTENGTTNNEHIPDQEVSRANSRLQDINNYFSEINLNNK